MTLELQRDEPLFNPCIFLSFTGKGLIYITFTYLNHICVSIGGEGEGKVSLHHTFVPLPSSRRMGNMKICFLIFLFFLSLCVCGIFQCKLSPHFIKRCCRVIPPKNNLPVSTSQVSVQDDFRKNAPSTEGAYSIL